MAHSVTLTSLILAVRNRCDISVSQVCTDTEITAYINESGTELNDVLARAFGSKYVMKRATFNTAATTSTYTLATIAADFMQLQGLGASVGGRFVSMREFKLDERDQFTSPFFQTYGPPFAYRLQGPSLVLAPTPTAIVACEMYYTPTWTALASGSDTVDVVDGWHELIIADVGIKVQSKQDLPWDHFAAQKNAVLARIEAIKCQRDTSSPPRISDVTGQEGDWPYIRGYR